MNRAPRVAGRSLPRGVLRKCDPWQSKAVSTGESRALAMSATPNRCHGSVFLSRYGLPGLIDCHNSRFLRRCSPEGPTWDTSRDCSGSLFLGWGPRLGDGPGGVNRPGERLCCQPRSKKGTGRKGWRTREHPCRSGGWCHVRPVGPRLAARVAIGDRTMAADSRSECLPRFPPVDDPASHQLSDGDGPSNGNKLLM